MLILTKCVFTEIQFINNKIEKCLYAFCHSFEFLDLTLDTIFFDFSSV